MTFFIGISLKRLAEYFYSDSDILANKIINSNNYQPVSILVPAYNEEQTIVSSVTALLRLHFPEYQVIVINDGSNDTTLQRLIEAFDLIPNNEDKFDFSIKHNPIKNIYKSNLYDNLLVADKENGGKADGLNCGINISKYPLFCCVDADSILEYDSILKTILTFNEDENVIAAGGMVGIINGSIVENSRVVERKIPKKLIEAFQVIEYNRGFLSGRTAWEQMNSLLIISGAFGIFKKEIVKKIGGYRHTIGEDFDLVVRMVKYCFDKQIQHSIRFVPDIACWTQAPSDYASLLKQRNRWHRGLMETLYHNRKMIYNPKYKKIGLLAIPYFIFIEALSPVITFIGILSILILYVYNLINKDAIIVFFLLEFAWGIIINIGSISLDFFAKHRIKNIFDIYKLLALSFLEPFYYRPLIKAENLLASFNFLNTSWGKIKRKSI
ncbi:MAG: glycosyltransferase family 2 protein [Epsilonproteobacteria bacterium]|nr:glycosyltransferase family 2 protein [Campylobacterota bacterium]